MFTRAFNLLQHQERRRKEKEKEKVPFVTPTEAYHHGSIILSVEKKETGTPGDTLEQLGQKASGSMQSGLATAEAIREGREKIMATVSSKPSKIASDFTSSVPLVKKQQQPVAKKRIVRIPALKAAEANRRLEEKKRNERELQNAAMKAAMAFKKQQREERDKKEKDKEKKHKCTEIDRQTQREEQTKKEPPRRARVVREVKEVQCNVIDDKEQSKRKDCGKEDAFVRPRETGSSIIIIDDIVEVPELPRVVEKSYEMSPYKDSDAEGDDGLHELEEDMTGRKKYIPSWARLMLQRFEG